MSDISDALKLSLSSIIGNSTVEKLAEYKLFDTALSNESLVTLQDQQDAESLDQKELLEIIGALEGQLENADGDEKDAIEEAIEAIYASLDDAEDAGDYDLDTDQEDLGEYLGSEANHSTLVDNFAGLEDSQLQADILKYFFNNSNFEMMQQLLGTLSSDIAAELIAEVAESE